MILTGQFAYKIKKPVRFPFLDFSTLERRRRYCEDELALNRRLAPELYLEVVPIGGTAEEPRIGALPAVEYAVKMVQFPAEQTLDALVGDSRISDEAIRDLADRVAAFHSSLPAVSGVSIDAAALENLDELAAVLDPETRTRLEPLADWTRAQSERLGQRLRQRETEGAIRECHGDLHLGNLAWIDDRIVPFDCLEFDRALRCIDMLDEVGFLVMDLRAHGRDDFASEFLNRYLEHTGDYGGLDLLRYYLVYRALVRCKVRRLAATQHADAPPATASMPYLDLASRMIRPERPLLLVTCGLSGSGKTTVSGGLVGRVPAVRVRSDIERKRIHGLRANDRSHSRIGNDLYTGEASNATYAALARAAEAALAAGLSIIVDAAFLERRRRHAFAALAKRHDAGFVMLNCVTDEARLRQRITEREAGGEDASEAGLAVLDYQIAHQEPIERDEAQATITIDTAARVNPDELARTIASRRDI